ncbi:ATP synthase F1, gamma subunit [Sulfobacillus acidophilus TPY]|uniref:ATP synthase gamma chain n=1 Tax=Sulfobacillus acidophilus (strain ATCC 700253 / DSM 10332 / NAL) TaxID=679936 RepID=G8TZ20_SULAD|nr:ATP synthase F1, gamma subunit [Sulfobacillus acidophilus TPY]AEW06290.1 ATP synthase F1 subcomplex gamma subunit [Sulfobacillus acidophilus DSM 10332]
MAGGLQELRRRIRSVQNTQQITRAMKLVAGAKLRRAEERARASRDYFDQIRAITARAVERSHGLGHPLLEVRPVETASMVVVTSDRGLAGPFNTNVLRRAMLELNHVEAKRKVVFAVGRKGRDFFRYRNVSMIEEFIGLGDDPSYRQARAIADTVMARYLEREVDAVYLTFTRYHNAMSQEPVTLQLLPVVLDEAVKGQDDAGAHMGYVFEPDPQEVFQDLLPRYVEMLIFGALLESKASEQGARMTAMDNASKNAEELIRRLILLRNRLRQAAITREIAELVGGAEALK